MTINERLAEIKARCERATPGKWTVGIEECEEPGCDRGEVMIPEIERSFHNCEWAEAKDWERDIAIAEFCAHSRTDLPALVAALEVAVDRLQRTSDWDDAADSVRMIEETLEGEGL